jgi:hypothetical protein
LPLFRTRTAAVYGIDAHLIDVEVDLWAFGNARDLVMVGMPDTAVRESRERIKSALMNSGFGYPSKALTINLAPANVRGQTTACCFWTSFPSSLATCWSCCASRWTTARSPSRGPA